MDFNLKSIFKAFLISTAEPLSIKDVQAVITRFHEQSERTSHEDLRMDSRAFENPPDDCDDNDQEGMYDLMDQVPSLLTATQIRDAMEDIADELRRNDDVFRLIKGPRGYRIAVSPAYSNWVRLLRNEPKPQKLSPASLETLAITAYRQPITRAELESVRGVNSDSALNTLLEREMIAVTGRAELPGRPIQYGTTDRFLEMNGLSSIEELPVSDVLSPNQLSEWIRQASSAQVKLSDRDMGFPQEVERDV